MPTRGQRLFAQYAHAPNALGYCGPAGAESLRAAACGNCDTGTATGTGTDTDTDTDTDTSVPALARQFSGAWPYQQVLAELAGIGDPLDERVVRGYWTGNDITAEVDRAQFGERLLALLAPLAGQYWRHLGEDLLPEVSPTHGFHVFGVYPWSRLLDTGMPQPLQVLDSCRIRWGTVTSVAEHTAVVRSQRLEYDGSKLSLGPAGDAPAGFRVPEGAFVDGLHVGDQVAVHWDFICDRLNAEQAQSLQHWTGWQLAQTNRRLGHS